MNELKVGDTAEVYEASVSGGYTESAIPVGHWSVDASEELTSEQRDVYDEFGLLDIYAADEYPPTLSMFTDEVRLVGKLTITKLK